MRKRTWLTSLLAGLAAASALAGFNDRIDFTGARPEPAKDGSYWLKTTHGKLLASIGKGAKVTLGETGELIVDATACDFSPGSKKELVVRFYSPSDKKSLATRKLTVGVTVAADRPATARLFIEGQVNGKHFWKAADIKLSDRPEAYTFSHRLPLNVNNLWVRFDCKTPAVYRFRSAEMSVAEETEVKPGDRLITNGGAERGWYGISLFNLENQGLNGKIYNWNGRIIDRLAAWNIDERVFHSGKRSFRGDCAPGSLGRLTFNPVPYIPGKASSLSVWLKAAKPGTRVNVGLFIASGIAYGKSVNVDTEWRKYELSIPSWGEQVSGVNRIGDVVSGYGCVFEQAYPMISADATIWVDDCAYALGGPAVFRDDAVFRLRGKLNSDPHCYHPGEAVTAVMELENATGQPRTAVLTAAVTDFFGRTAATIDLGRLELQPGQIRPFPVRLKTELRGAFNLTVTATDPASGRSLRHGFALGRLGAPGARIGRLGFDAAPQQNLAAMIPYLNDFRIGSVRLWSRYFPPLDRFLGTAHIPPLKQAGIYILFNVAYNDKNLLALNDLRPWQQFLTREFAPYKGQVDCYEILNEPNIWSGRGRNPDPAKYAEMGVETYVKTARAAAATFKALDPNCRIGGPTTCHTDIVFTANVLAAGGRDCLDIITEHPYRRLPELPDYDNDLAVLRRVIDRTGRKLPMMATEAGFNNAAMLVDNLIDDNMRESVALSIRNMLIAFAGGSEKYFIFSASLWPEGTAWHTFLSGNPDNNYRAIPNPVMYAMRTIADRIGTAAPVGRIKLGSDFRCYVFDRGDRRVAALWKWNGPAATLDLSGLDDRAAAACDLMGNPLRLAALPLDRFPIYLETGLDFASLRQRLGRINLSDSGKAFSAGVDVINEKQFAVAVTNRINRPVDGTVELLDATGKPTASGTFAAVPPEETARVLFSAPREINTSAQSVKVRTTLKAPAVSRTADFELRTMLCRRAAAPLRIDGNLADWPAQKPVVLTAAANAVKTSNTLWHESDKLIRAELRTAWDDDHFYLGVTVFKPKFHQDAPSPAAMWQGDSIQIGFDPLKNALKNAGSYGDDDFEYAVGLLKGENLVYRHKASSAIHDSLQKNLGRLNADEVKLTVRTEPGRTTYEMAFARAAVSPFRLQAGASMRWNIIINLNNGEGRMGWLELTPGIGQTPKDPGRFMDIVLTR